MIVLDTHIWVWWVSENPDLPKRLHSYLHAHKEERFGVSIISCWEVAKLVERDRLHLTVQVDEWIERALLYPEIVLIELTPQIAVESTQLPGDFHRDPADQIIVATA